MKTGTSKLYNRICYGYTHDNEGNLIVDEIEAVIVRTIFDMYLEGYSFSGISKELLCHNIKSPTGKKNGAVKQFQNYCLMRNSQVMFWDRKRM